MIDLIEVEEAMDMTDDDDQGHERDRTEEIDTAETDLSAGGMIVETSTNAGERVAPINIDLADDEVELLNLDVVAILALLVHVVALALRHAQDQKSIMTSILQLISTR
jgi:hypothetical protein